MISSGDIWTLIGWHLSFWGCKRHQAARPDSLVLLCSAIKKGNRPTTLAYSDNFSLNCLAKNYNSNKNHMGAAPLRPTWCLQSTLSTLQAWKKVQCFCEPDNCLLFGSHASNVRQPSGPVPGAAAVRGSDPSRLRSWPHCPGTPRHSMPSLRSFLLSGEGKNLGKPVHWIPWAPEPKPLGTINIRNGTAHQPGASSRKSWETAEHQAGAPDLGPVDHCLEPLHCSPDS